MFGQCRTTPRLEKKGTQNVQKVSEVVTANAKMQRFRERRLMVELVEQAHDGGGVKVRHAKREM